MLKNWVNQTVTTQGTGSLLLGNALDSFITISAVYDDGDEVHYSIVDGNNRENGLGIYVSGSNSITRANIFEKLEGGSFESFPSTPLSLTGSSSVSVTPSVNGMITTAIVWKENIGSTLSGNDSWADEPPAGIFINNIMLPMFGPDLTSSISVVFKVGHDIARSGFIFPRVSWSPMTTSGGAVRWGLEYSLAAKNTGVFSSSSTIYVNQQAAGVSNTHQSIEFPDGDKIAVPPPGTLVVARLFRDATHIEDVYPNSVAFHSVSLMYPSTYIGTANRNSDYYTWS
jgi:hypothetical protein